MESKEKQKYAVNALMLIIILQSILLLFSCYIAHESNRELKKLKIEMESSIYKQDGTTTITHYPNK